MEIRKKRFKATKDALPSKHIRDSIAKCQKLNKSCPAHSNFNISIIAIRNQFWTTFHNNQNRKMSSKYNYKSFICDTCQCCIKLLCGALTTDFSYPNFPFDVHVFLWFDLVAIAKTSQTKTDTKKTMMFKKRQK